MLGLMRNRFIVILVAVVIILLAVRTCSKEQYISSTKQSPVIQYQYEVVHDTLTTVITETKIDTVLIEIEERINSAIQLAETTVREVVKERDSVVLKIVELKKTKNITIYDTISVKIDVPPDSVIIYNIFEYHAIDGNEVVTKRDTIQSRKVSRYYAQKYIIQ
jgi:hypothetical protein